MPKNWECKDWDCKDPKGKLAGNKKRVVLILSRVHGGEQPASFIAQGTDIIVRFLKCQVRLRLSYEGFRTIEQKQEFIVWGSSFKLQTNNILYLLRFTRY